MTSYDQGFPQTMDMILQLSITTDLSTEHDLTTESYNSALWTWCVTRHTLPCHREPLSQRVHQPAVQDSTSLAHGLQHTRLPCLSPSPGICSNSSSLNWWCHPTISSSEVTFSSCLQSFPVHWGLKKSSTGSHSQFYKLVCAAQGSTVIPAVQQQPWQPSPAGSLQVSSSQRCLPWHCSAGTSFKVNSGLSV